ncbi:MAG: hypothetical protein HY209_06815 [Candidatus Omnitrophica bacterium]|nr:hypothetical protein [Candidatus Omnitrophota bacterium]
MWFFMYSCYFLSLISLLMLGIVFCQSFRAFDVLRASPMSFLILTSIIYLFTETLVIFFFVGTGVSVKEYMLEQKISGDFHKRMIALKRKVYPPQLLNMLILMSAFILYGAADTGKISVWIYRGLLGIGLVHFLYAKKIQHKAFKENTFVILEIAGIKEAESLRA